MERLVLGVFGGDREQAVPEGLARADAVLERRHELGRVRDNQVPLELDAVEGQLVVGRLPDLRGARGADRIAGAVALRGDEHIIDRRGGRDLHLRGLEPATLALPQEPVDHLPQEPFRRSQSLPSSIFGTIHEPSTVFGGRRK